MNPSREFDGIDAAIQRPDASLEDLYVFGRDALVYIRPVRVGGETLFGIWGADGIHFGYAQTEGDAVSWAWQQEREPVAVH